MEFASENDRWQAVRLRAKAAHASFVYAVTTTRIYCRPDCPSRLARRANVAFFDSARSAADAGFRPCKRCKPESGSSRSGSEPEARREDIVRRACGILETSEGTISAVQLAKNVGLSLRYFHTVFKEATGCTPAQYAKRFNQSPTDQVSPNLPAEPTTPNPYPTFDTHALTPLFEFCSTDDLSHFDIDSAIQADDSWSILPEELPSLPLDSLLGHSDVQETAHDDSVLAPIQANANHATLPENLQPEWHEYVSLDLLSKVDWDKDFESF